MAMRMTGLISGLDTENIISQMISGRKVKVESAQKEQTKLKWKKEAWSSLNTKLYSFYTGSLNKLQSASTFKAKKVSATNTSKITLGTSSNAINGVHQLSVKQVASSAYLTSKDLRGNAYISTSYEPAENGNISLSELKDAKGNALELTGKGFEVSYDVTGADGTVQTVTKQITARAGADGSLQSVIDNLNADLSAEGIGLTVSYNASRGALEFTNHTATQTKNEQGEVTGYSGGTNYKLKALDEDAAKSLGISKDGVTVSAQTKDTGDNVLTGNAAFHVTKKSDQPAAVTGATKLTDMGIAMGTTYSITVGQGAKAKTYDFTIDQTTTLSSLASQFSKMGISASYDEGQGRFFLNSEKSGSDYDFTLTAKDSSGNTVEGALSALGLDEASAVKVDAKDAIVVYNGATFQQSDNNFSLNGLRFTVNDVTETVDEQGVVKDEPIKLTVTTDTDGIYNAVKDFVKEYNALIKEMNGLYGAERLKDYEPLTDEEKDAMSEKEIEEWESKIKATLLRRDPTISSLLSSMRTTLNKGVDFTGIDGITSRYSLASFGINTGKYTEYGQLHINGDADDPEYATETDKLRKAIEENPDALISTLTTLGKELYGNFQKAMKSSDYSSALTFYNDVQMDKEIKSYDSKISKLQEKMNDLEDKYYKQFAAMESAMAEIQASSSNFASYFGSN